MVEELAKHYAAIIAEKEAQLQIIQTQHYCAPQSAALAVLNNFKHGVFDFVVSQLKGGVLLQNSAELQCMYWLEAHFMIHHYKEKLPEELWDDFLDKMSWFPGAAIERVLRARKKTEDRRLHILMCW